MTLVIYHNVFMASVLLTAQVQGLLFMVHHAFVLFPQVYLIYPDELGTKESEQEVVLPLFTLACFQCAWLSCLWKHHRGNLCCRCILLCRRIDLRLRHQHIRTSSIGSLESQEWHQQSSEVQRGSTVCRDCLKSQKTTDSK